MTEILNVDGLISQESKVVKIAGVEYPVAPMNVGDFLKISKMAKDVTNEQGVEESMIETIVFLIDSISIRLPTCPADVLNQCNMAQLNAIANYIRDGSLPDSLKVQEDSEKK
jgi:hypothetical protein